MRTPPNTEKILLGSDGISLEAILTRPNVDLTNPFSGLGGGYQLVLADPPWSYEDKCHAGERGAEYKYPCLTLDELKRLPVHEICAPDCLLAMWWVAPMPAEEMAVVQAWGFTLKTMKGFTWHKTTVNGKSHFGMGNWTRANTEDCLFAVRGRPRRVSASVRQFLEAPRGEHSAKPPEVRTRLVELMGGVKRIELFARERADGWAAWGNEVPENEPPQSRRIVGATS